MAWLPWLLALNPGAAVPAALVDLPQATVVRASLPSWAACVTGFTRLGEGTLASGETKVRINFDANALYIDFECRGTVPPVAKALERDGAVYEDDSVELFLQPPGSSRYYHFAVNSAGTQLDAIGQDASWNARWSAAVAATASDWTAQIAIPFAELGVAAPVTGETWRANFCRNRLSRLREWSTWAPVEKSYHSPSEFGTLAFRDSGITAQVLTVGRDQSGALVIAGNVLNTSATPATWTGSATLTGPGGETRDVPVNGDVAPSSTTPFQVSVPIAGLGSYRVRLALADAAGGAPFLAMAAQMEVEAPMQVTLRKYFIEGKLAADVALGEELGGPNLRVEAFLRGRNSRDDLQKAGVERFDAEGRGSVEFGIANLAPGEYEVVVTARDTRRTEVIAQTVPFTKPPKPDWLGSQEGLLAKDEVPWPWTPLQVEGNTVKCWGREYRFAPWGLPDRIVSAGEDVLAGPVLVRSAEVEGREGALKPVAIEGGATHVDVRGTTDLGGVRTNAWVEYDGVASFSFTVEQPGLSVSLEIPLKPEHAKYFHFWPGGWGTVYNSGAIPAEGMKIPFKPWVWIGDEERGLAWFCESDKGWDPLDRQDCITIARQNDAVVLRIKLRTPDAKPVEGPITYTFGLQATPVKPRPEDFHTWHIAHGAYYGMESQPVHSAGTLTYPMDRNVDPAQGTLEAWVTPMFDPNAKIEDEGARGSLNREFLRLNLTDGAVAGFYWNIDDRGMRFYVQEPSQQYPIVLGSHPSWQKGETHHVALTWGDAIRIYVDGKLGAEQPFQGLFGRPADAAGGEMLFGRGPTDFIVDEIRISKVPRTQFDLTQPPQADADTLLLDHLDETLRPDSKRRTAAPASGLPSGGTRFIEGKFGRALQLFDFSGPMTALDRAKELGVTTIIYHEDWTDIQDYVETTHKQQLHSLVNACHERGIKILLYFGYNISDISPDWDTYSDECLIAPRAGGYKRQPPQTAYIVCYRSRWTDYMANGIAHVMDEYNIDGIYLDGTSEPWACTNTHHGCGYAAPDGSVRPTYTMLAVRDHLRRLYMIVKSRKLGGQVNIHQSTCNVMTSLAYATSYWDGEQLGGMSEAKDPLDVLPLDAFRAEFMGHQWGVPAEFLCYSPHPYTTTEALAFTLPHGVLIHPSLGTQLEEVAPVWKAFGEFGVDEAEWIPYWTPDSPAKPRDRGTLVSLYERDGRALLVVSNLRRSGGEAVVRLDRRGLGIGEDARAYDALTGDSLELSGRTLRVPVEGFSARLVVVK